MTSVLIWSFCFKSCHGMLLPAHAMRSMWRIQRAWLSAGSCSDNGIESGWVVPTPLVGRGTSAGRGRAASAARFDGWRGEVFARFERVAYWERGAARRHAKQRMPKAYAGGILHGRMPPAYAAARPRQSQLLLAEK